MKLVIVDEARDDPARIADLDRWSEIHGTMFTFVDEIEARGERISLGDQPFTPLGSA
jgi:hypothetical protein